MRNIANVVHDLRPLQESIKEKITILKEVDSPDDYLEVISNIELDLLLFEAYIVMLNKEAKKITCQKMISQYNELINS